MVFLVNLFGWIILIRCNGVVVLKSFEFFAFYNQLTKVYH